MSNLLKMTILIFLGYAGTMFLFPDWFSSFWSNEKKLSESAKLLQQRFNNEVPFEMSGWSLRDIYVSDKELLVIVNYPPSNKDGKSRMAPVYSELVRFCPVLEEDSYWKKGFTQPFTLYLANAGKSGAKAIARCTRSFDKKMHDQITKTGSVSGSQTTVLPTEGEDPQTLNSATEIGNPSFNQAQKAMNFNKLKQLQFYLNKRPELVNLYDGTGATLLFSSDTPEEVKILIGYGANPNIQRKNGPTVLGWLSELGHSYGAVKALINEGADVNQIEVAYARTGKIAKLLLKNGTPISDNSLYIAIADHNLDVAEVLYAHGARLNKTTNVSSPLHYLIDAVKNNYSGNLKKELQALEAAIQYSENLEMRRNGLTPLEYVQNQADWDGGQEVIKLLLAHDVD